MIVITVPHKAYTDNKAQIKQIIKRYGMSWDDKKSGWVNGANGDGVYIDKSIMDMIMDDSFSEDMPMILNVESTNNEFLHELLNKIQSIGGKVLDGRAALERLKSKPDKVTAISVADNVEPAKTDPIQIDGKLYRKQLDAIYNLIFIFIVTTFSFIGYLALEPSSSNVFTYNLRLVILYIGFIGVGALCGYFIPFYIKKLYGFAIVYYPRIASYLLKKYAILVKNPWFKVGKKLSYVLIPTVIFVVYCLRAGTIQDLQNYIMPGIAELIMGGWLALGGWFLFRKKPSNKANNKN